MNGIIIVYFIALIHWNVKMNIILCVGITIKKGNANEENSIKWMLRWF